MTDDKTGDGGYSLNRRTALKAAGLAGIGIFSSVSFSGSVSADGHVVQNIGFVPNAADGTVSKVDLLDPDAGAESITIVNPHEGELTNRMVIHPETGNPWVLNSGRGLNPPDVTGEESQGQVIEIDRENGDVTAYDIGGVGDKPRAIEIVNGSLWVGFYHADPDPQYLLELDPDGLDDEELAAEDDDPGVLQKVELGAEVRPYTLMYDASRNILWLSSRSGSRMTAPGNDSVYSIDLDEESPTVEEENDGLDDPYFIAIDSKNTVWVTDFPRPSTTDGFVAHYDRDDNDEWGQVVIPGAGPIRGLAIDENDDLWLATSGGEAIQLQTDDDSIGFRENIGSDNVGVGIDANGRIWVIDRIDDVMRRLDNSTDAEIDLGREPYAYGDFAVLTGEICGEKSLTDELESHLLDQEGDDYETLEGWEIKLFDEEPNGVEPIATTQTDEDGKYCFTVAPGTYWVCENPRGGTVQTYPEDGACHGPVDVASEDELDGFDFENDLADLHGCTPGFWCNPAQRKGWWNENELDDGDEGREDLNTGKKIGEVFDDSDRDGEWLTVSGQGRGRRADEDDLAEKSLHEAVCDTAGGPDLEHAQRQLAGHATAALLNAAHMFINYPMTEDEVVSAVLDALDSGDRDVILAQKDEFDEFNNEGCTLNAFGEVDENEE